MCITAASDPFLLVCVSKLTIPSYLHWAADVAGDVCVYTWIGPGTGPGTGTLYGTGANYGKRNGLWIGLVSMRMHDAPEPEAPNQQPGSCMRIAILAAFFGTVL